MNNFCLFLLAGTLFWLSLINAQALEQPVLTKTKQFKVRVLLDEKSKTEGFLWSINAEKQLTVYNINDQKNAVIYRGNKLELALQDTALTINGKPCADATLYCKPEEGHLIFNNKIYAGILLVASRENTVYLINVLDIEDYVFSVLRTESWPGWPLEVNKVLAVAARSYVANKVLEARAAKKLYHIKTTNIHQTYSGVHEFHGLRKAVEETQGLVLAYNQNPAGNPPKFRPIAAMYDACCGGKITAHIHGVNFAHAPYLRRTYACTFCKSCKLYNWQAEYILDDFKQLLKAGGITLKNIRDIKVTKKDRAGIVQEVTIKDGRRTHVLTGKKMYALFKKIKSFSFSVNKKSHKIIIKGTGYGHHLGLCQWGAREMVKRGKTFEEILNYYFNGTVLMRIAV